MNKMPDIDDSVRKPIRDDILGFCSVKKYQEMKHIPQEQIERGLSDPVRNMVMTSLLFPLYVIVSNQIAGSDIDNAQH